LKSALLPHLATKDRQRNVARGENVNQNQSENPGCLPPQVATTFLTKFLMGTPDEVGDFDITTAKFDRVLQWAPGHGPCPEVIRKRRGRLRTFQRTRNFLRIVESMKKASAKTKKRESAVAEVMQETGFSRKTVFGALKIWKRMTSGWDSEIG